MLSGSVRARLRARSILDHFGIDSPREIDIRAMAFARGMLVQEKAIRGADGRLVFEGERALATIRSSIREVGQKRFVVAHELGHFELHRETHFPVCEPKDFSMWAKGKNEEAEANTFAAEVLMPTELYREECRERPISINTIEDVAGLFRVTLSAAGIRYANLDLAPCAVVYTRSARVVWYVSSESFPYRFITRDTDVHRYTGAGEYFYQGDVSRDPFPTPVEAWFTDSSVAKGQTCFEQCVPMPRYNSVLSLIWID